MTTAICIASGPSLTPEDVNYCEGKGRIYAVNDSYKLAPFAQVLYACDYKWWKHHEGVPHFLGEKWTCDIKAAPEFGLKWIESCWHEVFSTRAGVIALGGNSGFQALNLAVLQGAKKVILLGYDMKASEEGKRHWFGEHPQPLIMNSNYAKWVKAFEQAAPIIRSRGVEVINCSRGSAINCFAKAELRDIL